MYSRYGNHVSILNLVKKRDSGREILVGNAYDEACTMLIDYYSNHHHHHHHRSMRLKSNTTKKSGNFITKLPLLIPGYLGAVFRSPSKDTSNHHNDGSSDTNTDTNTNTNTDAIDSGDKKIYSPSKLLFSVREGYSDDDDDDCDGNDIINDEDDDDVNDDIKNTTRRQYVARINYNSYDLLSEKHDKVSTIITIFTTIITIIIITIIQERSRGSIQCIGSLKRATFFIIRYHCYQPFCHHHHYHPYQ